MNIKPQKFGIACALSAAVLWIVCSILVLIMPSVMLSISGDMLHMELAELGWNLTLPSVIKGLFAWIFSTGIGGWLLVTMYNRLL